MGADSDGGQAKGGASGKGGAKGDGNGAGKKTKSASSQTARKGSCALCHGFASFDQAIGIEPRHSPGSFCKNGKSNQLRRSLTTSSIYFGTTNQIGRRNPSSIGVSNLTRY